MDFADFIRIYWPIILGLLSLIVWAIRVEQAVKQLVADVEEMRDRRKEDLANTERSRTEVLAEIKSMSKDIRDIMVAMGVKRND